MLALFAVVKAAPVTPQDARVIAAANNISKASITNWCWPFQAEEDCKEIPFEVVSRSKLNVEYALLVYDLKFGAPVGDPGTWGCYGEEIAAHRISQREARETIKPRQLLKICERSV